MRKIYVLLAAIAMLGSHQGFTQAKTGKSILHQITQATSLATSTSTNLYGPTTFLKPDGFQKDRCGFVTQMNKAKAAGYDQAAFEAIVNQKIAEMKASRVEAVNYVIPVVFHVIHDGTAEGTGANIIASQVYQQIDQLNKDFGNLSGSPFPAAATTGLSFCPVIADPSGVPLAQPGIHRINRNSQGWTDPTTFGSSAAQVNAMINYIDGTIKPASIWDPSIYVNIWVYNFSNSGLLGYATFPTAGLPDLPGGETPTTAGVVFLTGAIGSVASPGTATPYALGRTVSHELGHFFGLYHVWGDVASCGGTDYCADTPPCSDQYFSQVPACTIPTQCSGQPRMIQNYMDYSDDGCMNTFTLNQTDRIQAVMLASPRRPKNPSATICTPPVANAFSFTAGSATVAETGAITTCPRFKDYVISFKPSIAASGNATVNFAFSGTATQNNDYSVIGSTSVSYVNGEGTTKSFTIRVNDDAAVESAETVIINYTISGSGLVAGSTNQTYTLTITDDDVTYFINNTAPTATLLSQNFGTTAASGALPAGWIKGSFLSPAGLNVWTVNQQYGASTGFTAGTNARVLHITNGNTTTQNAETAPATYTATSESDAVAITGAINTTGYQNIKVTFDYASNGEEDIDGIYDFGLLRYSITAQGSGLLPVTDVNDEVVIFLGTTAKTTVTVNLPAATSNVANLWLGFEWINDASVGFNPPFIIDNVVVTGESSGVETVLNQAVTQTHNQAQIQQYMSSTNNIIAAISNPNMNIGCNTATVTAVGTGQTNVTTTVGTYQRSNKVIRITPATPNSTATYSLTLYYTTAELAIWGANVSLLKILKVNDGVSLASTLNNSNAKVFSTTVDDQRATKGYVAFTANITGGFSQFMLASPTIVIPVTLVTFDARSNGKSILLSWSTATEANNKGFVIERSLNGLDFEKIGWQDGKGNSSQLSRYQYSDNFVQPNVLYYYRLRQTDLDNREKITEIRQAKIKEANIEISVSPNPAKDQLKVFVSGTSGLSDIRLLNASGQVVRNWRQTNATSTPAVLDISGLAAGMYSLHIVMPGTTKVEKLIIK